MKKVILSVACAALLVSCGNKKSEYDAYYTQDYKDSVATAAQERPVTTQTKVGADAAINDMTDSGAVAAAEPKKNEYELGMTLISKSDCTACHNNERKVVGPAYVDVAEKYEFNDKNVDYLAQKIIKGGAGVWGEIPMPPHADLSQSDAKEMARYVLSLKK
ncbi:c-type cytochrome [Pontibacter pudoricolor]|uniref:c-type cytochrome n=1 Tax=Pontibacter pudoricolor TaxID=2694930 RepID=UPI001391E167|nr:c-type cytochrome [Pontibacter pudoricolor]